MFIIDSPNICVTNKPTNELTLHPKHYHFSPATLIFGGRLLHLQPEHLPHRSNTGLEDGAEQALKLNLDKFYPRVPHKSN